MLIDLVNDIDKTVIILSQTVKDLDARLRILENEYVPVRPDRDSDGGI